MHPKDLFPIPTLALLLLAVLAGTASGQCILTNPSFEIGPSGNQVFAGWEQFGVFGSTNETIHGSQAARVSGPDSGAWGLSAFWQTHDGSPGERFEVTGHVLHPSSKPLTGLCGALVNIEWRDGGGTMIDYQAVTVADATSPTDEYLDFAFVSEPAPSGTAYIHFLVAVIQSPTDPSPDVYFDQVTLYSTTPPTIDDLQWNDFPGGRTVEFGGYTWRVKGPGFYGPGGNLFCHTEDCVWVDGSGQLHLTLSNRSGSWYSTEVVTAEALGYGDYILTTVGRLDLLDPQAVLGIFLWEYGPCWDDAYTWWNAFNEIDIEYSRWQNPSADIGQFVAQPYSWSGNLERFDYTFSEGEVVSHAMRWLPHRVEYRVWRGGPDDESPENLVHSWTYTGPHIPRPEQPRMHLNLWKIDTAPAGDQEVVFQDFTFVPAGGPSPVEDDPDEVLPTIISGRLHPASPNPFNPLTVVRFDLVRDGFTELDVFDMAGRRVRRLAGGYLSAGQHQATWDGSDQGGRPLASGVYIFRLRGIDYVETQRVALIK